jgi:hypothetical protein
VVESTPLKNDGVRQLGWWHEPDIWKNKIHVPNHQPNIISIHEHTSCPHIFLLVPNASPWLLDFTLRFWFAQMSGFHRDIPLSLIASRNTENKSQSAKYTSIPQLLSRALKVMTLLQSQWNVHWFVLICLSFYIGFDCFDQIQLQVLVQHLFTLLACPP